MDLNFLRTFITIFETQSVTKTAEKLSVTQPSVSYALSRLRSQLNDPLFIRGPEGMTPTTKAVELFGTFRKALGEIDSAVETTLRFDPATSQRTFRLCLSDLGEMAFLPSIMERLSEDSPRSTLEVVPMSIEAVADWLSHGSVDAAVASVPLYGVSRRVIRQETYACVMSETAAPPSPDMSMDEFMALRHIVIDQSTGHSIVDTHMEKAGIRRDVGLRIHHFSVLPHVLVTSNFAAIVPLRVAEMFQQQWPLAVRPLPFEVPSFNVSLYWNEETGKSPASKWFHSLISDALI